MVTEEKWFDDISLNYGENVSTAMIKLAKYNFNNKMNFPSDKNQHIEEIEIHNGCNTQTVQILHEKRYGNFIFKGKFIIRLTKPVGL